MPTKEEIIEYEWLNRVEHFDSTHRHAMNTEIGRIGAVVNQFLADDPGKMEVSVKEIEELVKKTKSHKVAVTYWLKRSGFRENKMLESYFKEHKGFRTTQDHLNRAAKGKV